MPAIRILPEILANKIAAGEVVERPASVVKELVENALDAGSTRILIDIQKGGRSLIQVADNGYGMSPDNALMALERFATSKIRNDADLFAIETLGFRGEALPSIAAVSKMTLVSRAAEAQSGVQVNIQGGKILQVNDAGAPQGTMVSVAQLFFNTPARRKFLKSISTEMSHIADTVAGMALGHHQVYFKLTHNGKTVRQWSRVSQPAERIADILNQKDSGDLVELDYQTGGLKLTGCLGPPGVTRSTSRNIYLFVNGRRVRDRVIQHALFDGFRGRLMKGQFPMAVLFLSLPFDQVDVNVHPTKHEVRFVDSRGVHDAVRNAVAAALSQKARIPKQVRYGENENDNYNAYTGVRQRTDFPALHTNPLPAGTGPRPTPQNTAAPPVSKSIRFGPLIPEEAFEDQPIAGSPEQGEAVQQPGLTRPEQQSFWSSGRFADLTVIGQFRGTYIICQDGNDLILIDQHAAHERIVYERLARDSQTIPSQRLVLPETVELDFGEADALSQLIPQFNQMGLEIEHFGGTTFVVKSIPTLLDNRDAGSLVSALAEKAAETGMETDLTKTLDACRIVMACHNAVRANQRLAPEQIGRMLSELDNCENPSHCPHGRPTWIRWTQRDLEKAFKRT